MEQSDNPAGPSAETTAAPELVLEARDLGLYYPSSRRRTLFKRLHHRRKAGQYWALRNVSFQCMRGDVLGVIGRNGAGKSTLSLVLSGIFEPDEGTLITNGDVSALLSLGGMFQPGLSGRDNTYYFGSFLGFSRERMDAMIDEIRDFSELGDFFDEPIGAYSSGMRARLAFSIAASIEPDILLLDEVLSVGDSGFRKKCEARIQSMMAKCRCIVVISHSMPSIKAMCNRCLWLERGEVKACGDPADVIRQYEESFANA
ncbi:MAG: lipopolysaccharide transport system ATP-binding protein [Candidatus Sumerlaeota bacterium]|nr:lipopolysaccharide transport system ATP-binding protein [Candidatus Sumerlaeota bacterium]